MTRNDLKLPSISCGGLGGTTLAQSKNLQGARLSDGQNRGLATPQAPEQCHHFPSPMLSIQLKRLQRCLRPNHLHMIFKNQTFILGAFPASHVS